MEIDPRHLAQLAAIAESGSFSGAARQLNVSQPALSSGIAQLERRLNVRVLERGRYGARLTPHGEALMRHWRIVSSQLDQAAEEIKLKALNADGPLTIGVSPVTGIVYVPHAIGALKRRSPAVLVTVVETPHLTTMDMLLDGQLDLAVVPVGIFPPTQDIEEVTLTHDELGFIIAADNTRYGEGALRLQDIEETDWVLPSELSAFRRQLEALFITSNRPWPSLCTFANAPSAIKAIVMESGGVTIMPRSMAALECAAGQLRYAEIAGISTRRAIGYTWLRSRPLSPVARQFVELLTEICAATEHPPAG